MLSWPQAVYYSIFLICVMLVIVRIIAAFERVSLNGQDNQLEESDAD